MCPVGAFFFFWGTVGAFLCNTCRWLLARAGARGFLLVGWNGAANQVTEMGVDETSRTRLASSSAPSMWQSGSCLCRSIESAWVLDWMRGKERLAAQQVRGEEVTVSEGRMTAARRLQPGAVAWGWADAIVATAVGMARAGPGPGSRPDGAVRGHLTIWHSRPRSINPSHIRFSHVGDKSVTTLPLKWQWVKYSVPCMLLGSSVSSGSVNAGPACLTKVTTCPIVVFSAPSVPYRLCLLLKKSTVQTKYSPSHQTCDTCMEY
jgi:hypothetical protein